MQGWNSAQDKDETVGKREGFHGLSALNFGETQNARNAFQSGTNVLINNQNFTVGSVSQDNQFEVYRLTLSLVIMMSVVHIHKDGRRS